MFDNTDNTEEMVSSLFRNSGVPVVCGRTECFANYSGKCNALTECLEPNCPFFKTRNRVGRESRAAMSRLAEQGRDVKLDFPVLYHMATKY